MKKKINLALLLTSFLMMIIGTTHVVADDNLAVSVNAVLPENQKNKDVTYYDLRMKPNQKQELDFELHNSSNKDQKVLLQINNATTNDVGGIDYSDRGGKVKRDESLKVALTDVAEVPKEVTVKAKSTKVIKIKLTMPKEEFKGEILGGIRVTSPDEDLKKEDTQKGGMQIKNKVAYTVGISLTESDKKMNADLKLLKVFPGQTAGRNVIKAKVQNTAPTILEEIKYEASITQKGKTEVLHKTSAEQYRFAPNSNFNFDIDWENKPFEAGSYTLKMKVESKETGQKWDWNKDFAITRQEAKKLNDKAIELDKDNKLLYIIIGLLIAIIIILIILVIFIKKKNKKNRKSKSTKKLSSSNKKKKSK